MIKIGIIGAPGTGKSTLAKELAKSIDFKYVDEYAREWIARYGEVKTLEEQLLITKTQLYREEKSGNRIVTDSPIFLGNVYASMLPFNHKDYLTGRYGLDVLNELQYLLINTRDRYLYLFYLPPILDPVDDGVRVQTTKEDQLYVDNKIIGLLHLYNIDYIKVDCDPKDRITFTEDYIQERCAL